MDLDYTQLITAIIAAYVALVTLLLERRSERQQEEKKRRAEAYKLYIKEFWRSDTGQSSTDDYNAALGNVYLTGSSDVLRATTDFHQYLTQPSDRIDWSGKASALYAHMIHVMREDASLVPVELSEAETKQRLNLWK